MTSSQTSDGQLDRQLLSDATGLVGTGHHADPPARRWGSVTAAPWRRVAVVSVPTVSLLTVVGYLRLDPLRWLAACAATVAVLLIAWAQRRLATRLRLLDTLVRKGWAARRGSARRARRGQPGDHPTGRQSGDGDQHEEGEQSRRPDQRIVDRPGGCADDR